MGQFGVFAGNYRKSLIQLGIGPVLETLDQGLQGKARISSIVWWRSSAVGSVFASASAVSWAQLCNAGVNDEAAVRNVFEVMRMRV